MKNLSGLLVINSQVIIHQWSVTGFSVAREPSLFSLIVEQ